MTKQTDAIMLAAADRPINAWRYCIETFLGVGFYAREDCPLLVFCTPNWDGDGILAIEVQHADDGDTLDAAVLAFDPQTIDRFVELVTPWLDRFKPKTLAELCDEYTAFQAKHHLALGSADEHLTDECLTRPQREWLRVFVKQWEIAEHREVSR